jgi:hypothetical protein
VAVITHYAVIVFAGDPFCEHIDPALRCKEPGMHLVAQGDEDHCWRALTNWTAAHPLRLFEEAEVLTRHPSAVRGTGPEQPPDSPI